jgi:hypothetical protein
MPSEQGKAPLLSQCAETLNRLSPAQFVLFFARRWTDSIRQYVAIFGLTASSVRP